MSFAANQLKKEAYKKKHSSIELCLFRFIMIISTAQLPCLLLQYLQ